MRLVYILIILMLTACSISTSDASIETDTVPTATIKPSETHTPTITPEAPFTPEANAPQVTPYKVLSVDSSKIDPICDFWIDGGAPFQAELPAGTTMEMVADYAHECNYQNIGDVSPVAHMHGYLMHKYPDLIISSQDPTSGQISMPVKVELRNDLSADELADIGIVVTAMPEPTPTFTAEPTLEPMGDADGDGYPNSWEIAWGSNPKEFTTFEDLKLLPVITGVFHTRKPYNVEDMNTTIYQQVMVFEERYIKDKRGNWETLTVEFILFPYVTEFIDEYVRTLAIPYPIPVQIEEYLNHTETSDSCQLESDMIKSIEQNVDNLYDSALKITNWNHSNLTANPDWDWPAMKYKDIARITTCEMMENRTTSKSTGRAVKTVSDFRHAGFPSAVVYNYSVAEIDKELHIRDLANNMGRSHNHPQTAIWSPDYGWIIYDYNFMFIDARRGVYLDLLITEIASDFMDMDNTPFFNIDANISPKPDWLYYSESIVAPSEYLPYLNPIE